MKEEITDLTKGSNAITPRGYHFVIIWAVGLLLLYVVGGTIGISLLRGYAAESAKVREARIKSPSMELNVQDPNFQIPSDAKPVDVMVGGSINSMGDFAMKESAWTADFYLWFSWNGDAVKPGEDFRIVNGQIIQKEKTESSQSGEEHYEEYRVTARMKKSFDASRFPFSEEGLSIQVEDASHGADTLRYVADKRNSGIIPEATPRAIKLKMFLVDTKTSSHGLDRVETGTAGGKSKVRSQFILALLFAPNFLHIHLKMFQALFVSVAISLIVLFIRPVHVDPRFGIPVGGIFAAVGNNFFISSILPQSDRLTLADMVNATGLVTIFFILVQSAASLYIMDSMGNERLSRFFDRICFVVFLIGYAAVNLALPLAARPL